MKRQIIILIVILFQNSLFGQKWENIYGNPGTDESFSDIIELYDHGYLIASFYETNDGCWLIKTDVNGTMLWEKFITWPDVNIYGGFLDQDNNGNIYIATVVAGGPSGYWPMITKLDSCGEKVWCRVFQDYNYNYNYGWFDDVLVLDNGDVVALGYLDSDDEIELIFLYYIDSDGNLLWRQGYASRDDYPHIRSTGGDEIKKYGDNYIIHGDCYYPYPSDTTHFYLRPLYIMLDSLFNEQWIIPFGVSDSIIGEAYHTIKLNDSIYMGVGARRIGGVQNSLLMFFSEDGDEFGYNQIPNEAIGLNIADNFIYEIERINDTLYLASSNFGVETMGNPYGEFIIDTAGTLYNFQSRPNTHGTTKLIKTFDNKYVIGVGYYEGKTDWDIYMYKINEELEHDTLYPGSYTYDSLCPNQIQSGNIDISDCLIITDVGEIPSPQEYYSNLQSIFIKAYPNPVKEGSITFEYSNTERLTPPSAPPQGGKRPHLAIYNVFGELVHKEKVYQFQGESKVNIQNWQKGVYFAIVYSNGNIAGKTKFIVQ